MIIYVFYKSLRPGVYFALTVYLSLGQPRSKYLLVTCCWWLQYWTAQLQKLPQVARRVTILFVLLSGALPRVGRSAAVNESVPVNQGGWLPARGSFVRLPVPPFCHSCASAWWWPAASSVPALIQAPPAAFPKHRAEPRVKRFADTHPPSSSLFPLWKRQS